ncbi:hypothetical protein DRP04_08150 [Archaeoglobales archaeon]|nr:MAG: hypothetical protein DRP04_08150 [Archaeoglobales archaeon]
MKSINSELYKLEQELESLKSAPKALTMRGREGNIIGRVAEDGNDVSAGMIVLFKQPPLQENMTIRLIEYQVRESKKTSGKYYIVCFNWVEESAFQETIEQLEQQIREFRKTENIQKLKEITNDPETALKLLKTEQREAFVSLLLKSAKAVLWNNEEFLIVNDKLTMLRFDGTVEISEVQSPVRFEPEQWKAQEFEVVEISEDIKEVPEGFIVIESWTTTIILIPKESKEIAERLKKISDSRLPEETKLQLYKALLGGSQ